MGRQRRGDMPLTRIEIDRGTSSHVRTHGNAVSAVAIDAHDRWVATGSFDGTIRIGPVSGDDPHVLLSQEGGGAIYSLSFSRDGRWIAAAGEGFRFDGLASARPVEAPIPPQATRPAAENAKDLHESRAGPDSAGPNGTSSSRCVSRLGESSRVVTREPPSLTD